jgi:hypothetical protein
MVGGYALVSARTRVSGPDALDPFPRADGDEHHSGRNQDEGGGPDRQPHSDRKHAPDGPAPGNAHIPTIAFVRLAEWSSDWFADAESLGDLDDPDCQRLPDHVPRRGGSKSGSNLVEAQTSSKWPQKPLVRRCERRESNSHALSGTGS